ncbi:hypothetical protein, partial [Klebsiella pneumoniae]|uniref:hypothetical protein n=1 Tax=Klebsiella pneumoniae TaxID=573 RepID=UPI0030139AE3
RRQILEHIPYQFLVSSIIIRKQSGIESGHVEYAPSTPTSVDFSGAASSDCFTDGSGFEDEEFRLV